MKKYENFYETVKEAEMRLVNTIVLYDGEPYYVLAITDHKGDGIFRIYLDKLGFSDKGLASRNISGIPYEYYDGNEDSRGKKMDEWLSANPDKGIIRKFMNSKGFNNYRPFPLGMFNWGGDTYYLERMPQRSTQQGLVASMLKVKLLDLSTAAGQRQTRYTPNIPCYGAEMFDCIMGNYPDPQECLKNLTDPKIGNSAVGFHRNFALIRGPVDTLFLSYKEDPVGVLPDNDFSTLKLSKSFTHVREVVEGLQLFNSITI